MRAKRSFTGTAKLHVASTPVTDDRPTIRPVIMLGKQNISLCNIHKGLGLYVSNIRIYGVPLTCL